MSTDRSITRPRAWLGLLVSLVLVFVVAAIGARASIEAADFYGTFQQPAWAPPSWVFGPVWTLLYAMMGIAAWLVWRRAGFGRAGVALSLYAVQLALNALWSWLFFAWNLGGAAFAEIVILWALIAFTTAGFWIHQRVAAWLMLPYLAWVTFAAVLNFSVWRLNPGLL